ncbi:hypothetical protein CPB84DRAFT_1781631, partial [Gymnopilus junonius]
ITSQIFCHAVSQPTLPKDGKWRRYFSPLCLGRICRDWRKFAWSTPELWSTIVIEWLDRAGRARDLEIYFSKAHKSGGNALGLDFAPIKMLQLLADYSAQWSAISFRMPHTWLTYLDEFGRDIRLSCPRLRSFLLDDLGGARFSETVVDLTDAPLLSQLTFRNSALITDRILRFPLQQIDSIDILPTTFNLHQCMLRLPNVAAVHFTDFYVRSSFMDVVLTSHPNIRSLELTYSNNDIERLLEVLSLPALETLKVAGLGKSPNLMMDGIWPFIDRSRCKLTSLHLRFNISNLEDEEDIYEFLSNVPDLKELYIHDPFRSSKGLSRVFFNVLHPSWTEPYLPFLETFSYEGPLNMKPQEILDPLILRARLFMDNRYDSDETAVATELRSVHIKADQYEMKNSANEPLDSETLNDLQDLMKIGVFELSNRDGTRWIFSSEVSANKTGARL